MDLKYRLTRQWKHEYTVTDRHGTQHEVCLCPNNDDGGGPAYDRAEWNTTSTADVERRAGRWYVNGEPAIKVEASLQRMMDPAYHPQKRTL